MLEDSEHGTHPRGHGAKYLSEEQHIQSLIQCAQVMSLACTRDDLGPQHIFGLIPTKSMLNPRVQTCISKKIFRY